MELIHSLVMTLAFALAPALLDPADHAGGLTGLLVSYAVHDALVKPMPGSPGTCLSPAVPRSWSTISCT